MSFLDVFSMVLQVVSGVFVGIVGAVGLLQLGCKSRECPSALVHIFGYHYSLVYSFGSAGGHVRDFRLTLYANTLISNLNFFIIFAILGVRSSSWSMLRVYVSDKTFIK